MIKFVLSSALFFCVHLPMIALSFVVVPFLLHTRWDGTTTWFGNFKYGRGDTHEHTMANGNYWKQWWFLCVRNPVSNFGKRVISVKPRPWVWLKDSHIAGRWYWKYGWKNPVPENNNLRTFVYRPWRQDKE